MNKIYLDLKNCYGISSFIQTFEFDEQKKAYLIYAPNGIMKTSFANTLSDIALEKETKDYFYPDRVTTRVAKYNDEQGSDLLKEEILVIEPYCENYKSGNITVLLADKNLKKEYEDISAEINSKMADVYKKLTGLSGKRDAYLILAEDFKFEKKNIYDCLEKVYLTYKDKHDFDFSNIQYSKLFNIDTEKILKDKDFIRLIKTYIEKYEQLLIKSNVFKKVFDHNNADDVVNILKKDGFFAAKHKVLLENAKDAIGEKEFAQIIVDEKKRILDTEMDSDFQKIDEMLSKKIGTKALREYIFNNREIISELGDVEELKKKIWIAYLFAGGSIFQEAILNFQNNKIKLLAIIEKAKAQRATWDEIVKKFNERFSNMPFIIGIENKEDVILKSEAPTTVFKYKDRGRVVNVKQDVLMQHLSNGEKKALYILNIIFEIEARKKMGRKTILVVDDIADSFDYRNKYAIIEYLKGIIEQGSLSPIILTHNFDFYRTVAGRCGIKGTSYFVDKSDDGIKLVKGEYFENVFNFWRDKIYTNDNIFLASIAFIRNIVEYTRGNKDKTYINLTNLLHYKKNGGDGVKATDNIQISDLIEWYNKEWGRSIENFKYTNLTQKVIDLLFQKAEEVVKSATSNAICIENKIILSIAIRQKAERFMVAKIGDDTKVNSININQTRELKELIKFTDNEEDKKIQEILERVLIITSENIHINSFMYEPILDMSLRELSDL